jgi:hypothetical protein
MFLKKFILLALSLLSIGAFVGCGAADETPENKTEKEVVEDVKEEIKEEKTSDKTYPLYITTMTHMEGNWDFVLDAEPPFTKQVEKLEYGMDLAEEYGAILTVETEQPFAEANVKWDRNVMQEILDRGHGVGSHCDRGGSKAITLEQLTEELALIKGLVDDLVGAENNKGCSGAGAKADWAQAMVAAGFDYVDGIVGFHMQAFPLSERPEGWDDKSILSEGLYHENVPVELEERIHLIRLADTLDWEADETGIVVSSGEMGQLTFYAEGDRETCTESRSCPLDEADVDAAVGVILEAAALHDTSRVAKISFYFPTGSFEEENEDVLRYFFSEMQRLEEEGVVKWGSQLDVYEAYVEWENDQK